MTPPGPRPSSIDTLEGWHRSFAAVGIVPVQLSWEDLAPAPMRHPADLPALTVSWFAEPTTKVFLISRGMNAYVWVVDYRLINHPNARWVQTADAPDKLALVQFPGAGTWMIRAHGYKKPIAVAIFTRRPKELPVIQRRAREIVAGFGRAPRPVNMNTIAERARLLKVWANMPFNPSATHCENVTSWPPTDITFRLRHTLPNGVRIAAKAWHPPEVDL